MEYDFPKPDWSLAEVEPWVTDIGVAEGVLPDGRPYLVERWRDEGCDLATFYFSPLGLASQEPERLLDLFIRSEIVNLKNEPIPVDAGPVIDSKDQRLVSLNVVLSDPIDRYAELRVPTNPYK